MAEGYKVSGNDHFRAGRYPEAADAYLSGLALSPPDALRAVLHANLAAVRAKQFDWEGAFREANAAVLIDASLSKAHFRIGVALSSLGRPGEAAVALTTALRLDPLNANIRQALDKVAGATTGSPAPAVSAAAPPSSPQAPKQDCCDYCRLIVRPDIAAISRVPLYVADRFYYSTVLCDQYPSAETEELLGIRMGTALGSVVFKCWQRILCLGSTTAATCGYPSPLACPAAVGAAVASGTLPAMFERAVRELAARGDPTARMLVERGFKGIPWDAPSLAKLMEPQADHELFPCKSNWKPFTARFSEAHDARVREEPAPISGGIVGVRFIYNADTPNPCTEVVLAPSDALISSGVASPVLALCGVPVTLSRVRVRDGCDNQAATYFMIDPRSGYAPSPWQSCIGEVVALRSDGKPFTSKHFYALWNFFNVVLDDFSDRVSPAEIHRRYFSATKFREFMDTCEPGLPW